MPQLITPLDVLTSSGRYPDRMDSPECVTGVRIRAADTAERVSKLLGHLGVTSAKVSSGFRTKAANSSANGAPLSAHQTGEAVDLADKDGSLARGITTHNALLRLYDLYLEDTSATPGWVHLQTRPTKSGKRVFLP